MPNPKVQTHENLITIRAIDACTNVTSCQKNFLTKYVIKYPSLKYHIIPEVTFRCHQLATVLDIIGAGQQKHGAFPPVSADTAENRSSALVRWPYDLH